LRCQYREYPTLRLTLIRRWKPFHNWALKTPPGFIFALKIPRTITHEKVLVECDKEFEEFVSTVQVLGEKLGPMVFQFPFFNDSAFSSHVQFVSRLQAFFKKLPRASG
jgi:uncharacterized protein YecE (DUF72 family)